MLVKELLNIYESINRDVAKLKSTINSIPGDRDYTNIVQNTIYTEIEKFENLKKLVLTLEVNVPEDYSSTRTPELKINLDYSDPTFFPSSV